LKITLFYWF